MDGPEAPTGLEIAGLVGVTTLATTAVASLLLAWAGAHDGVTAVVVGVTVGVALAAVVARRRRDWRLGPWSRVDAGLLAAVLVLAASQAFPGFPLAAKNRDPGVYVNHAVAIADQGSTTLTDPVGETGAELVFSDGAARIVTTEGSVAWRKLPYRSFPTDPERLDEIDPDFFHLWPSTLATAKDLGGRTGLFNLTPALAVAAVGLLFLATRRAFGTVAATVGTGLLAVNELQVWQAKFPTAEALSQCLYAGALLAVVIALSTRWRVAAGLGGALVGVGFVARPEGIIVVGLAAIVVAGLWVVRGRLDPPVVAFTAGLLPPLLLGTYQAYGRDARYAELQEGLPSFALALAGAVLLVTAALVLRVLWARMGPGRPAGGNDPRDPTPHPSDEGGGPAAGTPSVVDRLVGGGPEVLTRRLGYVAVGLFAAFLVFAWFRPELLGDSYRIDKNGQRTRGYDEMNLHRLVVFLTPVALVAAVGALVVGVRERWSAACWALVVPGLLITPVLVWEPHIAPDLMWWGRRYVPVVVPTLLVLVGVAAGLLWERKGVRQVVVRLATVAVVLAVGAYTLRQSSDLWGHEEFGGSLAVIDGLDAVVPDDGVVVWQGGSSQVTNFAVTPFTWLGLPAIAGPPRPTAAGLRALQVALDDRPLYLVADGTEPPAGTAEVLEAAGRITGELSEFEHGFAERPRRARPVPVDLTVWRLTGD